MQTKQNEALFTFPGPFRSTKKPSPACQLTRVAARVGDIPTADSGFFWNPKYSSRLSVGLPRQPKF